MTQLYSSLIRTLLLRYLKDKEEYKDTCRNINSFKDLPQPVYYQFCEICKIAYTGIMSAETELIFQDLSSDFEPLGLMQTCPELYVDRGASVSHNFLHLTLQEYLAAYHISQQSRDEQVAFMKENIDSKRLKVEGRFLAGLSELGTELWEVVRGFASEVKSCGSFFGQKKIKLQILHWLFESQDPSAVTGVLGSDCVCFSHDSFLPFDWYVLGYCIAHSSCDWKLELKYGELESVEQFLRALQFPSTGKIKEVWLWQLDLAAVHLLVENMSQMLVFHNLTHLGLKCHFKSEICNHLWKETHLLQHLECLNLGGKCGDHVHNTIGRGGAVNLITSLTQFSTIRELNMQYTAIDFEGCKALSELLATSKYIKVLNIGGNDLSSDSIQLIVDGLSCNTSLEELDIHNSNLSLRTILHLASVLRVNTMLKMLNIGTCNIQSSDSVHLAKALEENTTTQLQTLKLSDNPIGSEGAVAFADMLATNKSLANLNMSVCSIQGEGAVCLAKAMEKNSTVRGFSIRGNPIGSEGAVAFADMLATNNSLAKLDMSVCIIQAKGAVCLSKAMEKNQCLETLELKDVSVGVEGALELIESLKHNTTLEKLVLSEKLLSMEKFKPPSLSTLDKTLEGRVTFCPFMPHSFQQMKHFFMTPT